MKYHCFVILLLLSINSLFGQEDVKPEHKQLWGVVVGFGNKGLNDSFLDVRYVYEVYFLQGQYVRSLWRKRDWSLEVLVQPQVNLTRYKTDIQLSDKENGYEYGFNAGVLIRRYFQDKKWSVYAFISSGPHYVSGTPNRQSSGFIFSDNFFVGCTIRLSEKLILDLRPGFRHISNAGLKNPNGGVNNAILSGGVLVPF